MVLTSQWKAAIAGWGYVGPTARGGLVSSGSSMEEEGEDYQHVSPALTRTPNPCPHGWMKINRLGAGVALGGAHSWPCRPRVSLCGRPVYHS